MSTLDDARLRHLQEMASAPEALPDEVGDGRYALGAVIDRGGMGLIVRARDRRLERDVALKILAPDARTDAVAARMEREARILGALEHPGIIPIHDVGHLDDGRVWMAMKLVRGECLDTYAARLASPKERVRLFLRVCEPLAFAHEHGFVHRDLKPANVMVGPFGEVLVMDWGVARAPDEVAHAPNGTIAHHAPAPAATQAGTLLGTPGWMAPEQQRGERADAAADVYALGRILASLAGEAQGDLPRRLGAVIARATAELPGDRYGDVSALAADVARWLDDEPVLAYRESLLERASRLVRRHRVPLLLIAGYVVMRWIVYAVART